MNLLPFCKNVYRTDFIRWSEYLFETSESMFPSLVPTKRTFLDSINLEIGWKAARDISKSLNENKLS